jgi:osmotically inducible lipoprotein OsmB
MKYAPLLSIISLLALSACGHSTGDRALRGGAIGAGVGVVGALVGAPPLKAR